MLCVPCDYHRKMMLNVSIGVTPRYEAEFLQPPGRLKLARHT